MTGADDVTRADALKGRGDDALRRGRAAEALPLYEESLALYVSCGDGLSEANCLQKLGRIALEARRLEDAQELLGRALDLHRTLGDEGGVAADLGTLGPAFGRDAQYVKALECLEEAVEIFRRLGDRYGEALVLRAEGNLFRDCYGPEPAIACWVLARALLDELHDPAVEPIEALMHNVRMRLGEEEWASLEREVFPRAEGIRLEGVRCLREGEMVEGEGPTWQ
ncbi:MAG TPA: tetratricopeptide repeat protein [Planctomycetota bacterium]|nr:tetratricopeptide repeat protein [Planctomycetota bacterium]